MTVTIDALIEDAPTPDFKRDQWGRPHIMQPDGKRKGYTRCSSAAKTIEDTFNLEKWARRNIAYGMAYDSSLVARVIAIGGEPSTWKKAEKDQVNAILEAADAVAKAHRRADMGTAVHHMTHRLDRGEEVIAGPYQADIDAYVAALKAAHLTVDERFIECRMVNDDLEMAGTADRILYNMTDFVIADIKTGATIDFGGLGWSAQLAAYAGGTLYDVVTEQRIHTPPIDRHVGLIIHLPAGEGRCDLYEVDIERGLVAARLANDIRAVRKESKTWIKPFAAPGATTQPVERPAGPVPTGPAPTDPTYNTRRKRLLERYRAFNDREKMAYCDLHIDGNNLDAVEAALNKVDSFNVVVAPAPVVTQSTVEPSTPPDEGDPVSDADVKALQKRFEALPLEGSLWTGRLVAEGKQSHDFRIKDRPTVRRYEIYRGILALAEWAGPADDIIRSIVHAVNKNALLLETPGCLLGQLNADEARTFATLAHGLITDRLALAQDEGTETLRIVAATTK